MRFTARVVVLVVLWLLAWGEASIANLASGLLVAGVLLVAFPAGPNLGPSLRIRPFGVARLLLYILGQLPVSNLLVAREIVSRRASVRTGVLAYPVQHASDEVVTLMANIIALTPGAMTVEATRDPAVIYVHYLILDDVDQARRALARLERLVANAVGLPDPSLTPDVPVAKEPS